MPTPPASHADLLVRPLFAAWGTLGSTGEPLVNPMWFVWDVDDGLIRLTHTTDRRNYANIRRDARVALLISDPEDPYRYLQVRGRVESIQPDPDGAFHQRLQRRYRGEAGEVVDRAVRVVLNVRPTGFRVRGGARSNQAAG